MFLKSVSLSRENLESMKWDNVFSSVVLNKPSKLDRISQFVPAVLYLQAAHRSTIKYKVIWSLNKSTYCRQWRLGPQCRKNNVHFLLLVQY